MTVQSWRSSDKSATGVEKGGPDRSRIQQSAEKATGHSLGKTTLVTQALFLFQIRCSRTLCEHHDAPHFTTIHTLSTFRNGATSLRLLSTDQYAPRKRPNGTMQWRVNVKQLVLVGFRWCLLSQHLAESASHWASASRSVHVS